MNLNFENLISMNSNFRKRWNWSSKKIWISHPGRLWFYILSSLCVYI